MNIIQQLKQLPKENWVLFSTSIINRIGTMVFVFLVLYLHNHLKLSLQVSGIIIGSYGAGALLAGPLSGWLADKLEPIQIMLYSLFISGVIILSFPLFHSPLILCLLMFSWGLISESYRPSNQVLVSHFCAPEQRKPAFALNRLGINLGMSIGPLLGSILVNISFLAMFIADASTTILAGLFLFYHAKKNAQHYSIINQLTPAPPFLKAMKIPFSDPRIVTCLIAGILSLCIFFQAGNTLSLFVTQYLHHNPLLLGMIWSFNCILIILFEIPINMATAHWSFSKALLAGAVLIGTGFGGYYFVSNYLGLFLGAVIWTFGEMFLFVAMVAYLVDVAPTSLRGTYMGLFTLAINIAMIFGPMGGLFILNTVGFHFLWLICFMVCIISAILFIFIRTKPEISI